MLRRFLHEYMKIISAAICSHLWEPPINQVLCCVFFPLVSSPKKWNSFVLAVRWSFFPFLSVSVCLFFAFFALYWNRFSREEWKKKIPATNQEIWREKKLATEQNVYVSTSVILSISLTRSINVIHLDPFTRSTSFACLGYVVYILSPLYMYIYMRFWYAFARLLIAHHTHSPMLFVDSSMFDTTFHTQTINWTPCIFNIISLLVSRPVSSCFFLFAILIRVVVTVYIIGYAFWMRFIRIFCVYFVSFFSHLPLCLSCVRSAACRLHSNTLMYCGVAYVYCFILFFSLFLSTITFFSLFLP